VIVRLALLQIEKGVAEWGQRETKTRRRVWPPLYSSITICKFVLPEVKLWGTWAATTRCASPVLAKPLLIQLTRRNETMRMGLLPRFSTSKRRKGTSRQPIRRLGGAAGLSRRTARSKTVGVKSTALVNKSECSKLYCDCFRNNSFCSPSCSCTSWFNMEMNTEPLEKIRRKIRAKNPSAFVQSSPAQQKESPLITNKPCRCKRSQCMKNYCECRQMGRVCCALCSCKDCANLPKEPS